jgi:carboxymethylenebutenolidase
MSVLLLPLSPMLGMAQSLPADGATATARLEASPRHGEWITYDAGGGDQVQAWVAYPERSDPAPVVVVIHDIRAMSDWARAVGDQLAADGFIAVVPDLLSGEGPGGGGTESFTSNEVGRAIRDLDPADVNRRLRAAAAYGTSLPSATDRVGVVGSAGEAPRASPSRWITRIWTPPSFTTAPPHPRKRSRVSGPLFSASTEERTTG